MELCDPLRTEQEEAALVARLAAVMRQKLRENRHKPWPRPNETWRLFSLLLSETDELRDELLSPLPNLPNLAREAADVAIFAAFIAETAGAWRLWSEMYEREKTED